MLKKTDWEAACRDLIDEGRQRLGEPPGADELLASSRGELSAEQAARVQEHLIYHPELARVLQEPFPEPDEILAGGSEDLSDDELSRDWERLRESVTVRSQLPPPARPSVPALRTWRLSTLAAASVAAVFAGLFLYSQLQVRHLTREIETPRVGFSRRVLLPDQQRGANQAPILLSAGADHFLLTPSLTGSRQYPAYRIDLLDVNRSQPERIWRGTGLRLQDNQTFEIWVPRAFLKTGDYRFELYGLDAGRPEPLATYTVRLE